MNGPGPVRGSFTPRPQKASRLGASVRLAENSAQGRDLARLYSIYRVIDSDPFTVTVVP